MSSDVGSFPRVSVIHPARNEHSELAPTVQSMLEAGADEVIVFDDGSDTPIAPCDNTIHIRHDTSLGPSVCRNLGAGMATGDVFVFADAHTRADNLKQLATEALSRNCILVPRMRVLYGTAVGYNRNFILKGKENELFGFDTTSHRPESRYSILGGNWGGFFVVPRQVYETIGGWVDHAYWGYNDPSLIVKAWFCGIDTVLDRDSIYQHKGKKEFGYPVSALHPLLNMVHSQKVIFSEDTCREYWFPRMSKAHPWMFRDGLNYIACPKITKEAEDFQSRKVRSDSEFFGRFVPAMGDNGKPLD